eukprot:3938942-Rhodomonas_salina.1
MRLAPPAVSPPCEFTPTDITRARRLLHETDTSSGKMMPMLTSPHPAAVIVTRVPPCVLPSIGLMVASGRRKVKSESNGTRITLPIVDTAEMTTAIAPAVPATGGRKRRRSMPS